MIRCWWLVGLVAMGTGCEGFELDDADAGFDDGAGGGVDGSGGEDGGGTLDLCVEGCRFLDLCDLCWPDADGECYSVGECVDECRAQNAQGIGDCLTRVDSCEAEAAIDACFSQSSAPDGVCAQACGALDGCELCDTDEAGECLAYAECVSTCETADAGAWAQCVVDLASCDDEGVAACYAQSGPPDVGDDTCAQGCEALDACGFAEVDDEDNELSVAACAEACRGGEDEARFGCYANAAGDTCEAAISACDAGDDPGDDACARACEVMDGCDLCLPDEADECLSVADCAASCREDATEMAMCVVAVDGCDEDAINQCIEG